MQGMFFGFLAAWWPLRHEPNVLLMHFADMKKDLPGSIRKVADFLGIEPERRPVGQDRRVRVLRLDEATREQVRHARRTRPCPSSRRRDDAKGQGGRRREDGMTDEIAQHLHTVGSHILRDEAALGWLYRGGELG